MNPINKKVKVNYEFPLDNEVFTIIGETRTQYLIEGDFSAGTNNVSQKEWIDKELVKEWITPLSSLELISIERQRQIDKEGWTPEHDAEHTDDSLAKAAACYAMPVEERLKYSSYQFRSKENGGDRPYPRWWPKSWNVDWWKPTPENRIKELVKAGALILAEIDRLKATENDFWVQCDVCKQQLKNWTGSTPCCGSIAYRVENGEVTKNMQLFASVNGGEIKSTEIKTDK